MSQSLKLLVILNCIATFARDAGAQEAIDRVAVQHRLYSLTGRNELGVSVGSGLLSQLTYHWNFNLVFNHHFSETWGVEVRAGYAVSGHTGLAQRASAALFSSGATGPGQRVDDFANLWEMKANGIVGAYWSPLYGKVSIFDRVPIHFQTYLTVGGGLAQLQRQSVVYCQGTPNLQDGTCPAWLQESRIAIMATAAAGFKFFTHQGGAVLLEARDNIYSDSYRVNIDRSAAQQGVSTGDSNPHLTLTHLLLVNLGYVFLF